MREPQDSAMICDLFPSNNTKNTTTTTVLFAASPTSLKNRLPLNDLHPATTKQRYSIALASTIS